jgi:hypothetical protein
MHDARHALRAGSALNDETHALPGNVGPADQLASSDAADSAAQAAAGHQDQARAKELATVAAEAALLRCSLHALQNGGYLVTRQAWGLARQLDTLSEVRQLLRLMAGGRGGAQ